MKNQIERLHQMAARSLADESINESYFAGFEHALRDMELADPAFALGAERAYRIALSWIDSVFEKIGDAAYQQVLQKGEPHD
ncbi:hypothetical protein C815_00948 [Firmicutes bacterium M10-2]|nr:hypothetical protein C815_00948 [Firmicutes bacterium M10-2]